MLAQDPDCATQICDPAGAPPPACEVTGTVGPRIIPDGATMDCTGFDLTVKGFGKIQVTDGHFTLKADSLTVIDGGIIEAREVTGSGGLGFGTVCAFASRIGQSPVTADLRDVRGASCDTCDTNSCTGKKCKLAGKVCIDTNDNGVALCPALPLNDPKDGNTCVPAAWKLKATATGQPTKLFDLTSNPEEEERLDFRTCKDSNNQTPSGAAGVESKLEGDASQKTVPNMGLLNGWLACVADDTCDTPY